MDVLSLVPSVEIGGSVFCFGFFNSYARAEASGRSSKTFEGRHPLRPA
jgi:hypothetical protein